MADYKSCKYYAECPWRSDKACCPMYCTQFKHKDEVRVVRCRDCKNYGGVIFGYTCRLHSGPNTRIQMKENDFCSCGERKDNV